MSLTTLRIEGEGATPSGYRAFLDDQEITNFTYAISLDTRVGDVNTATIEVFVGRVDLSADVRAKLVCVDPRKGDEHERTSFASKFREWVRL